MAEWHQVAATDDIDEDDGYRYEDILDEPEDHTDQDHEDHDHDSPEG